MKSSIHGIRYSLQDWQQPAFDALISLMGDLALTEEEKDAFLKQAGQAARIIPWTPYDAARRRFMKAAAELLKIRQLGEAGMERVRRNMYVCFMENRIAYYRSVERIEQAEIPPIEVREKDCHNTELAAVFAHLPDQPETEKWLRELDVDWEYDQLHMVTWFSCQLSLGSGEYSRSRPNHSAKTTYERLLNPFSLLWIAAALGEDRDLVIRTRKEIDSYVSWRAKCGVIRRAIPWSRIHELALPLVGKERGHLHD